MARARNIKPSFFMNELLVELDPFDRLLFIGLWCLADREGRIEYRLKRIKMELFPCDTYDVDKGLNSLIANGFLVKYTVNNVTVISIVNFLKHQSPHGTEKDSDLPDENGNLTVLERDSKGLASGKKRKNNVKPPKDNSEVTVNKQLYNSGSTVTTECTNGLNPESGFLNPEFGIRNPEHTEQAPVDNFEDPVCVVLKDQGIQYLNPSDPEFTRLKSEGADIGLWSQAAMIAVDAGNAKFDYVLGIVRKKLKDRSNPKSANGHSNGHIQSITTPGIKGRDPTLARMDEEAKLAVPMPENVRNLIREKYQSQMAVSAGAH